MKLNPFLSAIGLVISALLSYYAYYTATPSDLSWIVGVATLISLSIAVIPALAMSLQSSRLAVGAKVLAGVFALVFLGYHIIYAHNGITMPNYVIWSGLLVCIYLVIMYVVCRLKLD